jgi:4'-phosphopantetheinyl transferase EntD
MGTDTLVSVSIEAQDSGSALIAQIVPPTASAAEARVDLADAALFPAEVFALGRAVAKRRREFTTARACARRALAALGLPPLPIPAGASGEPLWPAGIVGSITHCAGYRACVVARATELMTIGIDAEPHHALPGGVLETVALADELAQLTALARSAPHTHWDRLLFSAKESCYKAWFQLTGVALGFEDARLDIDRGGGRLVAHVLAPRPAFAPGELAGRWLVRDGLVLTAFAAGFDADAGLEAYLL